MWRWNLNEVHCISRLAKISVFSTSEEWPIFRMKDVGMEFSGWLPRNLIGPWVLSPCRRQPVLHFLPSWSLPYHFLLLTGSPASILPRFSVPPPFPFFCSTLLPHTVGEQDAAGCLERTLGCLWLLSRVFMLWSLQKLLADVGLLLKLHLYLQHERRERLFLKTFNWHGCTIQSPLPPSFILHHSCSLYPFWNPSDPGERPYMSWF